MRQARVALLARANLRLRPPAVRTKVPARNRIGATSRPQVQQARVGRGRPEASSQVGGVTG
jgi:hypothetical protein